MSISMLFQIYENSNIYFVISQLFSFVTNLMSFEIISLCLVQIIGIQRFTFGYIFEYNAANGPNNCYMWLVGVFNDKTEYKHVQHDVKLSHCAEKDSYGVM